MNCVKCGTSILDEAAFCPYCGKRQTVQPRKAIKRPNGSGTVYKLSGRRRRPWVAAKSRVVIGYYAKKTDALNALSKLIDMDVSDRYNMTFAEVFDAWKAEHFVSISKSGAESYERAYKVFEPLQKKKFRDLRASDYQRIMDLRGDKSRATQAKDKQLLTQMSEWAVREDIATTNYARFITLSGRATKEKEIFTDAEIETLKEDGSSPAKVVLMLLYTGMRIGELFKAKVIDYHGTYIIGGEKTEAGRNRVIPIRPEGREYFAEMVGAATGDLIISGYPGQRTAENFRKRDYYPMLERLGIVKKSPHATRHTFASWAVKSGVKPEILKKILGHSNYSTTADIYVHADTDMLVSAIESVSNLLVTDAE